MAEAYVKTPGRLWTASLKFPPIPPWKAVADWCFNIMMIIIAVTATIAVGATQIILAWQYVQHLLH